MPSFVNSALLWVLPAAAIPVIIYYLMRFRSLKVTWGANYVLERALERLRKKLFLDQLLLLVLRTLACLALIVAFARPLFAKQSDTVQGSGVQHLVVIDGSYSLLAADGSQSRWDLGMQTLQPLLQSWGRGERWSLVLLHDEPRWLLENAAVSDPATTAAALQGLEPAETAVDLGAALADVFARSGTDKVELYLLTDDQASAWESLQARGLPAAVPVYWIAPPLEQRGNRAVTRVTVAQETALTDHPVRVSAAVRNFSRSPAQDVSVEVLVDGRFVGKETLSLLPDQEGVVHLDVTFDTPGSHYVTARLPADALAYDNTLSAGVIAVDTLRLAVLRDKGRDAKFDSAYPFFALATDVLGRSDADDIRLFERAAIEVSVLEDGINAAALAPYDVVVVDCGVLPTADLAASLRAYRDAGGGLLFAPDETADVAVWNRVYGEAGLLPGRLGRLHTEALGSERYETIAPTGFEYPALAAFEGVAERLAQVRFFTWFDLEAPAADAAVVARFSSGLPFALVQRQPLGLQMLLAGGLNGKTNTLIVSELFYPLIFRLSASAAAGSHYPLSLPRRSAVQARLDGPESIKAVTFNQGNRPAIPLALPAGATERATVVLPDGSDFSGLASLLVVRDSGSTRHWLGIQGERQDSDLTAISAGVRERLAGDYGITEVANWEALDAALRQSRRGAEWHPWVMAALLLFLIGEMLMQRRFI